MSTTPSQKNAKSIVIFTTILLGSIAVATAWSGYQSTLWSSKTSSYYSKANVYRSESVKDSLTANQLTLFDISIFTKWIEATALGQTQLATFYVNRMRSEAKPAFDAWLAKDPLNSTNAPSSPFVMKEYIVQKQVDAGALESMASNYSNQAQQANKISIEYVLTTVILALALFFSGMATRIEIHNIRLAFVLMSSITFTYGLIQLFFLWFNTG